MKIKNLSKLALLMLIISSCSIFRPSQKEIESMIEAQNSRIDSTSMVLKRQIKDLPADISDLIVVQGNPDAQTVLINAQGGPMTSLHNFELMYTMIQAKVNKDSLFLVNVHQYQTLRTKEFETKLINFEDAKKHDAISTKMLAQVVEYFKSKGNNVIVMGISFGAFVVEDLLANYPTIADKYIVVVGRLDMPDQVWKEFAKGNYVGFKYKHGEPNIVKFTAKEAGMGGGNSIGDKNTSILAAGLGYKRFTQLLKDKDLSKVSYFYGTKDDQVGRLSDKEIDLLKSKNVVLTKYDKDHGGTIDEFSTKNFKSIVDEVSRIDNHSVSKQSIDPSLLGSVINKNYTTDIPFEWSGDLPIVTVNINGKDYKFLFDTDAPTTIPEHLVNELQLQTVGAPIKLYDSDGRQLERHLYKLPQLKIGDISFKDYVVMSDDFKSKFPLSCLGFDGIFGYNFMKDLKIKLDYVNQKITISDKEIPHKNYTPVTIFFRPVQGPVVEVELPFAKGNFIIDTGKNTDIQLGDTGVIPEMDKLNYEYRDTRGTYSSSIGGQNTDRQKREYLLTDFTISPSLKIKSFPMSVDQSHAFLIGNQFLKHFNIIIDFPNQKAYFQNIKDGAIDEGFVETFGFTPFWNENDGLFISAITDKTPASKANLKVGDKILSLNGKDASNMKQNDFCSLMLDKNLNKKKRITITIQRDNMQRNLTLEK